MSPTGTPAETSLERRPPGSASRALRVAFRLPPAVLVTAVASLVPLLARWGSLGSRRFGARVGTRACRLWARLLCAILGVEVRRTGPLPTGAPFVVAANHLSYLDIMVLGSLYPSVFVAKREIGHWPLFGWIARGAGTLFVDRDRPRDVSRVGGLMTELLVSGLPLTLFPEGWSSPGEAVGPFLPSLLEPIARTGVPCHAATLGYETPGETDPPSRTICWYDAMDFLTHLIRVMGMRRIVATVTFSPRPLHSPDRKELARMLRDEVLRSFVPIRQASLDPEETDASLG